MHGTKVVGALSQRQRIQPPLFIQGAPIPTTNIDPLTYREMGIVLKGKFVSPHPNLAYPAGPVGAVVTPDETSSIGAGLAGTFKTPDSSSSLGAGLVGSVS